jgi:hypothetical protein
VTYGEGVRSTQPTPQAVAPLSGRLDELVFTADLVDIAVTRCFMPVAVHEANLDEWTSSSPAIARATHRGSLSMVSRSRGRSRHGQRASDRHISVGIGGPISAWSPCKPVTVSEGLTQLYVPCMLSRYMHRACLSGGGRLCDVAQR